MEHEVIPPIQLTEEELRLWGWLRENEAILTVRMTREEYEKRYGTPEPQTEERK